MVVIQFETLRLNLVSIQKPHLREHVRYQVLLIPNQVLTNEKKLLCKVCTSRKFMCHFLEKGRLLHRKMRGSKLTILEEHATIRFSKLFETEPQIELHSELFYQMFIICVYLFCNKPQVFFLHGISQLVQ